MLDLTLGLNQATYSGQEDIRAKVTLRNTGDAPLIVNGRLVLNSPFAPSQFRDVTLRVTDEAGAEIAFAARVNTGAPKDKDFKELGARQSIDREFNIRPLFELAKPGKYSVRALYHNQADPGNATAWKGDLSSNSVSFELA